MRLSRAAVAVLCASTALSTGGVLLAAPAASASEPGQAATAIVDTTPPALHGLAVAPQQVDVSSAATTVAVSAQVDDPSGVASVSLRLGALPGPVELHRSAGEATSGTWTGVVSVEQATAYGALDAVVAVTDAGGAQSQHLISSALVVSDAAPAAPASVTATSVVDAPGSVLVEWSAPPANGGSPVVGYDVDAAPADATLTDTIAPVSLAAARNSTTIDGLQGGTRYVINVLARNAVGAGTPAVVDATTVLDAATVADAPTALVVTPGDRRLDVAWAAPASDGGSPMSAYELVAVPQDSSVPVPPVVRPAADAVSAGIPGLVNAKAYAVTLRAVNGIGRSLPAVAAGAPRGVPGAPSIGSITAGNRSAKVRWGSPSTNNGAAVQSYVITALPSGRTATAPAAARSLTMTGLPNGVAAAFKVAAVNVAGKSASSKQSATVIPRLSARLAVLAQPAARVVHGTASVVTASLTAAGVGVPNQVVDLMAVVRPSTTWRRVATGRTSSTGKVTLRATLPATSVLRIRHPLGAVMAAGVDVRPVTVAMKLTAVPSAAQLVVYKTLLVRGGVAPAHHVGSKVSLQRYVSGGWRAIAAGSMTSTGSYSVRWAPTQPGTYTLRVVKGADRDHSAGVSPTFSVVVKGETMSDVARAIINNARITLATVHVDGIRDLAHARQNGVDVAAGRLAHRSSYGNAPGGYTAIDMRVLRAIRMMGTSGSVTISEIAGGSHAINSKHFYGRAVDISWVNGRHVGPGSGYGSAVEACRAHGASAVFHPSYDPVGGHSTHIHCQWG